MTENIMSDTETNETEMGQQNKNETSTLDVPQMDSNGELRVRSLFKFKSKARKARNAKEQQDIIDDILEACDAQEGLDIYQWCAFESKMVKMNKQYRIKYLWSCFKAIICSLLQTVGLLILGRRQIIDGVQLKGWCEMEGDHDARILAIGFSFYVAFTVSGWLKSLHDEGMYNQDVFGWDNTPWFVSPGWISFGYTVNLIGSVIAVWVSFFIIFFQLTPFDIIINAVAVFFLLDIDDLLMHTTHYESIGDFITKNPEIPKEFQRKNKSGYKQKCKNGCLKLLGYIVYAIYLGTNVLAVVMPILIGICY
mmetsp:Transcript_10701/g.13322  ORF Transcript_10701/g.13322 Transcript_10701/m.13322 type:complete len:308 (+) Transcript_10701:24-947(+)